MPVTRREDGGAAFPVQKYAGSWTDGMTLRDYFAAKALQGIAAGATAESGELPDEHDMDAAAQAAYGIADAMLRARST